MIKERLSILNIWVDPVTMDQALDETTAYVEKGTRVHTIYAANPEKNFSVPKDPLLHRWFKEADLLIPDGIGMVAAARLLYGTRIARVPGCELMQNICSLSARKGYKIFLYGATEDVNEKAGRILQENHPGIQIAGRANGYVTPESMNSLIHEMNASGAQILFVALGSPAQEKWISSYKDKLSHVRVCQGIGGTLDVIAGTVNRAPKFFCRLGLEWLYRLLEDPKRWNRQKMLPLFAIQVFREKIKNKLPKIMPWERRK